MVASAGLMSLQDALHQAEREVKAKIAAGVGREGECCCELDAALELARVEAHHPSVVAVWRDTTEVGQTADLLFPSRKVAALVIEDTVEPQAVGHALVQASQSGLVHCVRSLRAIQNEHLSGSMLVGRFSAFALLKAAESGHADIVRELLNTIMSSSTATMGYALATKWKGCDQPKDQAASSYPFVPAPEHAPTKDWLQKLASAKNLLPPAGLNFQADGWDLRGLPGLHAEELHEAIRATYRTFLLWRVAIVAACHCQPEVIKVLLKQRAMDNAKLAEGLVDSGVGTGGGASKGFDHDARKIIADRAKMDTLMYQLMEEYSTKNYHDSILYALWGHIQRGGRDSPRPEAGRPRCVAQAQNGLWEMQLEVPLMMMPVEHALHDEEPFRRYKQLTQLFNQRAKVNIQLIATVEIMPTHLQVTVGIKHVRFKVENSRWDEQSMGHFPCLVNLAVTPVTKEGTGVTMTNSSSNVVYKIGMMERVQAGVGIGDGMTKGLSAGARVGIGIGVTSTMKNKPWRFEQLPLKNEHGGSFVWTLQAMKGQMFDRTNPLRMAETSSKWRFGRRVPDNPLHELPFTSEGGVIFTATEFDDTMIWRFPKHMEGTKLRWNIEGQIHSTYTTSRYFETRMASFCGDIEEKLKALEVKAKGDKPEKGEDGEKKEKKDKGEKGEKGEKDKGEKGEKGEKDKGEKGEKGEKDKGDKKEKGEKGEKGEKDKGEKKKDKGDKEQSGDSNEAHMDPEYLEWLEFKRYKEKMQAKKKATDTGAEEAMVEKEEEKKEKKEKNVVDLDDEEMAIAKKEKKEKKLHDMDDDGMMVVKEKGEKGKKLLGMDEDEVMVAKEKKLLDMDGEDMMMVEKKGKEKMEMKLLDPAHGKVYVAKEKEKEKKSFNASESASGLLLQQEVELDVTVLKMDFMDTHVVVKEKKVVSTGVQDLEVQKNYHLPLPPGRKSGRGRRFGSGSLNFGEVIDPEGSPHKSTTSRGGDLEGEEDLYKVPKILKHRIERQNSGGNLSFDSDSGIARTQPAANSGRRITGLSVRTRSREMGRLPPSGGN